jgi:selenophosphate synthetase-related protein
MLSNMYNIVDYAIKTKRFVGGLGRLKKDGSIVKINGQIFDRKTTKNGDEVILVDNFFGKPRKGTKKRWQLILMKNLVALNENKWRHTKAA